jgi:hypothetical protein
MPGSNEELTQEGLTLVKLRDGLKEGTNYFPRIITSWKLMH